MNTKEIPKDVHLGRRPSNQYINKINKEIKTKYQCHSVNIKMLSRSISVSSDAKTNSVDSGNFNFAGDGENKTVQQEIKMEFKQNM